MSSWLLAEAPLSSPFSSPLHTAQNRSDSSTRPVISKRESELPVWCFPHSQELPWAAWCHFPAKALPVYTVIKILDSGEHHREEQNVHVGALASHPTGSDPCLHLTAGRLWASYISTRVLGSSSVPGDHGTITGHIVEPGLLRTKCLTFFPSGALVPGWEAGDSGWNTRSRCRRIHSLTLLFP